MTFIENLLLKGFIDEDINRNIRMNKHDYIVRLLTYCAKSDKEISKKERDFIVKYIESINTNNDRKIVLYAQYDYARFNSYDIIDTLFLKKYLTTSYPKVSVYYDLLYQLVSICLIDNSHLNNKSLIILKDYIKVFNLNSYTCDKVFDKVLHEKKLSIKKSKAKIDSRDDYYKILGLDKNCTKEELKKRYAYLSKNFHPDKYNFEYIPYEIRKELENTYKKINSAYDKLK